MELCIDGKQRNVFGGLAVVSADNLGSLLLGWFKESCTALKMCRFCMATKEESRTKVCWCIHVCIHYYIYCDFLVS